VVDWHNYGYSILSLNVGEKHWLVKFAHWLERTFGSRAADHFCVTAAMKEDLAANWGVANAKVLHDRPPPMFAPTPLHEKHTLIQRLQKESVEAFSTFGDTVRESDDDTLFTTADGAERADRPALLISSTSWTPDEDFGVLLTALEEYEVLARKKGSRLPNLLCVITGKGPLRAFYEKKVAESDFLHVRVTTMWLAIEDYPLLLGSADIGICLHTSSSGLDLPMKVVDMFGCGLPVCAIDFKCLPELVKHDENGLVFDSPTVLARQFERLLEGFPAKQPDLRRFRSNLESFRANGWDANWNKVAKPILS